MTEQTDAPCLMVREREGLGGVLAALAFTFDGKLFASCTFWLYIR